MRVLGVCQGGNVRSVALGYILKYGYDVDGIARSWERNTLETIALLGDWADRICVLERTDGSPTPVHR
jgi:hypothetical protein